MSDRAGKIAGMDTPANRPRVTLEPALEEQVALMGPGQRLALARVYARWARQLRVSAKILEQPAELRKPPLRKLPRSHLVRN